MLVVSNTSPILNLALIDRLSLIQEQFNTIIIPKGVLEELRVEENLPGSKKILDAMDAKWVLLDESEARRIAKDLGLRITGVLGILLRAFRQERIPSLRAEMERLRENAGFYIADQLFEDLLKQNQFF